MKLQAHLPYLRRLLALLLLGLTGCGLSDYQRQMDAQRERITKYDETNNLLDDPIEMPTIELGTPKKETQAWLFDFFLRLPKGCGTAVKERTPYFSANFPFFRYGGVDPAYNYFVCAAVLLDPKASPDYDKYSMKDFRTYAVKAIADYHLKTYKSQIPFTDPDKAQLQRKFIKPFVSMTTAASASPEPIGYDEIVYRTTGQNSSFYRVYFHEEQGKQICIVAQRPQTLPADSTFEKSLEACLATLDMSAGAANRRQQFKDRKR